MDKAIVDRIVDDKHAVLLVGNQQIEKVIPLAKLPDGLIEGAWVNVEFSGDDLITIELDEVEIDKTKERIRSKMDLLRARSERRK